MAGSAKFVDMIMGVILIIIGLVLLPIVASFIATSKADANVSAISGLTGVLDLIAYGFTFALVFAGVALMYIGYKK